MNRVIHINFQGSVFPIEETAADLLRRYIDDLRHYFAKEEGRDEIISDIESRIAELFLERMKKGAACISDQDMREIMAGIGMPEDLEAANVVEPTQGRQQSHHQGNSSYTERGRLFRAANDQIWGGVAAGIAYHFNIDPAIVRLLFVLAMFAGFGLIVYIVLWAVLPKQDIRELGPTKRRRLFRNMDDKKIGGVASGIAAYFDIAVWIPRVLFLAPLILSALDNRLNFFEGISNFLFPGFSGSLFIIYFVLWAVVPAAHTAAEKLQMRGEKVDLNSIQKKVNEELEQFKSRAERWSKEAGQRFQDKAKEMQQDLSGTAQQFSESAHDSGMRSARSAGQGIALFAKVIAYMLLAALALTLLVSFGGLFTVLAAGHQLIDYILIEETEKDLLWAVLILLIGVPAIGLLTWLVRAVRGVPGNKYTSYALTGFHIVGWACLFLLISSVSRRFHSKTRDSQEISLAQPSAPKMYLRVMNNDGNEEISDWKQDSRWPLLNNAEDSVFARNIRIKAVRSKDTQFHLRLVRIANGSSPIEAESHAAAIQFPLQQQDTILYLPKYIRYPKEDKFHAQQALLILEVPKGAKIIPDRKIQDYDWTELSIQTGNGFRIETHDEEESNWNWDAENEINDPEI